MARTQAGGVRSFGLGLVASPLLVVLVHIGVLSAQTRIPAGVVVETEVSPLADYDRSAAVAMDGLGRFIVAWQEFHFGSCDPTINVFVQRCQPDGAMIGPKYQLTADNLGLNYGTENHMQPSIAMSRNGQVRAGWWSLCIDTRPRPGDQVLTSDFGFLGSPTPVEAGDDLPMTQRHHQWCSVGTSDLAAIVAFIGEDTPTEGLLYGSDPLAPNQVEDEGCGVDCWDDWAPCVAMRSSDGLHAIVWAHPEENFETPPLNIMMQIYDAGENPLLVEPVLVNEPGLEYDPSQQQSPAVALDDAGNLVVTWAGMRLPDCDQGYRVYARRFKLESLGGGNWQVRDPDPAIGEGRPGMFMVDNHRNTGTIFTDWANPTVALWTNPVDGQPDPLDGSFIIAWNTESPLPPNVARHQVHAQYFGTYGTAVGREFRVNQSHGDDGYVRLAKSGQHTLAYGPDRQVVAV